MAYPSSKPTLSLLAGQFIDQEESQASFQAKLVEENNKIKQAVADLLHELRSIKEFPEELMQQLQDVADHKTTKEEFIELYRKINQVLLEIAFKHLK